MIRLLAALAFTMTLFTASTSLSAHADSPGAHPAFLHALTDLRAARWHLGKRGGSEALKKADDEAIVEIDHCIDEIKKASIDDGKNLDDHPKEDAGKDKGGDVHRARKLLEKARKDIKEKETNPAVKDLREKSVHFLDEALRHVDESLKIGK